MLRLEPTSKFRKDVKRCHRRGYDLSLLIDVIRRLQEEKPLDQRHRDHPLTGGYAGYRECHIQPTGCWSIASAATGSCWWSIAPAPTQTCLTNEPRAQ